MSPRGGGSGTLVRLCDSGYSSGAARGVRSESVRSKVGQGRSLTSCSPNAQPRNACRLLRNTGEGEIALIEWLPHVNVSLNATATLLLIIGFVLIKQKREKAHRNVMLSTFGVNMVFLVCYLVYHYYAGSKQFPRDPAVAPDFVRYFYYGLLASHVMLAAAVRFSQSGRFNLGLMGHRERHRRLAKWSWPIWLYVSVTGVLVYLMLYQIYVPPMLQNLDAWGKLTRGDSFEWAGAFKGQQISP